MPRPYPKVRPGPELTNPNNRPAGGGGGDPSQYSLAGFPPSGTFDPAYAQQARAAQRGFRDLKVDTRIGLRQGRRDRNQALRDIRVSTQRKRTDFATDFHRGMQKLRYSKSDTRLKAGRGREDFATRLQDLRRRFTTLGGEQGQAANAAGVLEGGTVAEAAQRRQANFQIARQPLDTGLARLNQDTATSLGRLTSAQRQSRTDYRRSSKRLGVDTRRDKRLTKQDWRRSKGELKRGLKRGKREYIASQADYAESAGFDAYTRHPKGFRQYGPPKGRKKK